MTYVKSISVEISQDHWEGTIMKQSFLLLETDFSYKPEEF